MKNTCSNTQPNYFDRLTDDDKERYFQLKEKLSLPSCKNRRNRSNETFQELVNSIRDFVMPVGCSDTPSSTDEAYINRALVCGIVWLNGSGGIAINTHQLSLVTNKCKSSINGSFQALGYGTTPTGTESSTELLATFPFMKKNFGELRQWTVRQRINNSEENSLLTNSVQTGKPLKLKEIVQKRIMSNKRGEELPTISTEIKDIYNIHENNEDDDDDDEYITPPEEPLMDGKKEDYEEGCSLGDLVRNLIKKRAQLKSAKPTIQEDMFTFSTNTEKEYEDMPFDHFDGFFADL